MFLDALFSGFAIEMFSENGALFRCLVGMVLYLKHTGVEISTS